MLKIKEDMSLIGISGWKTFLKLRFASFLWASEEMMRLI